jgi:oligopeptide transport system substrate-binding protein
MPRQPRWVFIAASFCLSASLAACQPPGLPQDSGRRADRTLYRVNDDEIRSLDPHQVSVVTDLRLAEDLFEGLTDFAPDGAVVPGLAKSWTVTPDGRRWSFSLRPGLVFSDGTPITAADVVYSLRRLVTPETAAPYASMFYAISGARDAASGTAPPESIAVQAPDPLTVTIALDRPWPSLPEALANAAGVVVPRHVIERHGSSWIKPDRIVSSGPFTLRRWVLQSEIVLDKNPRYYAADAVALDHVVYYPIADDHSAVRRFRAGDVDVLETFPENLLSVLERDMGQALRLAPYRASYYWVFNMRKPPFDDARVRMALSMAIDREVITRDVIRMPFQPAWSVIPAELGNFGPALKPDWADWPRPRRIAEARRLLAAAGISPQQPITVEVRFNSDEGHKRIAVAISQMWAELGVRTSLFNSEAAVHFRALKTGEFTIGRASWIADFNSAENFLFKYDSRTGELNYSGYNNPAFDALLDRALDEPDDARRNQLFRQGGEMLLQDMPAMPIYFLLSRSLVSPDVVGWEDNPAGLHGSRYLQVKRVRR